MHKAVAAIAVAAQLIGLVAIYWMFFEFITLPEELLRQFTADTKAIQQYVFETGYSWFPWPLVGLVGAFVSWLLILNRRCSDAWFLELSRVLAWFWVPLIPVGTLIGLLILKARARSR